MCWCNIKSRWRKMIGSFLQPTFLLRRLLSNHSDFSAKSVVKDWTSSFPPLLFSFLFWKRHLSDYSVANSQKFLWSSLPIYLLLFAFLKTAKIQKVESYPEKKMAVFFSWHSARYFKSMKFVFSKSNCYVKKHLF